MRARASVFWNSVGGFGVIGRRAIDQCPGRSNWTTVAAGGETAMAELPNLWAAREVSDVTLCGGSVTVVF
jgi:hypothetical protein